MREKGQQKKWRRSHKDKFFSAFNFTLLPQGQHHLLYGLCTYIKFLFLCVLCCVVDTAVKPEAPWWELKFTKSINSLKVRALKVLLLAKHFSMPKSFAPAGRCFNLQMSSDKVGTLGSKVCSGDTIFSGCASSMAASASVLGSPLLGCSPCHCGRWEDLQTHPSKATLHHLKRDLPESISYH